MMDDEKEEGQEQENAVDDLDALLDEFGADDDEAPAEESASAADDAGELPLDQEEESAESLMEDAASSEDGNGDESFDSEDDLMAAWGEALAEQGDEEDVLEEPAPAPNAPRAKPVQFQNLEPSGAPRLDQNLDLILDIPVTLSVEMGKTKMEIRELLQLAQGSVVELDRLAGEPMDIMVNGYLIAQGEVVLVNDKFGIRLTDVVSPQERVKKLR